ncbi:PilZ domain-containing protein [Salinivibrio sp. ES.052]|uniref:PilZ domain-containing protein n=1 Tax=Salinivibrio sp. ES.052 TaxID=1882823 RepID=UPI000925B2A6|nr:PilZ domain-containing protein [Salinivibrio sp. ES.052]SIO35857.1 PilZ domain-containing protein [Salinivibrio sp. ES.052]
MARQNQLKSIEKNQEVVTLSASKAALKLGCAALVRVHIQTPTKGLFRFNAVLIGTDGLRFCYLQLPALSVQQKGQYFYSGYQVRIHGVAPDGSLVRFSGKIQGMIEAHHTLLGIELSREEASATPLRQDKRFSVELSASLTVDGKASVPVTIHDISVGGCLLSYRAVGLQMHSEDIAVLSLTGIAANQDLAMSGQVLSHRRQGERYVSGLRFDDRAKSRSAWLITNLNYDGERYGLSIPHNDGELTASIS